MAATATILVTPRSRGSGGSRSRRRRRRRRRRSAMRATSPAERLEEAVLQPLRRTSRGWYLWVGFLVLVVGCGLYAYSVQLRRGLIETGMRDVVIWGFYITNFVFFIGISHAGTLISAILRVTHAE